MRCRGLFILLLIPIIQPLQSRADVVYPARLEIKEEKPAEFSVRFTLPMINNRRLRAEPVLPSACADMTEKEIRVTPNDYAEIRRIRCSPDLLFGESIAVRGLIGTQVDVILFLDMLDGRSYTATLKPAKAVYVIPHPPSLSDLIHSTGLTGVRRIVARPEIFLFLFLIAFLKIRWKNIVLLGCGFLAGYAAGQYLYQQKWLQFSSQLSLYAIPVAALLPAIEFLKKGANPLKWLRPLPVLGLICGLLFGGSISESFLSTGLSTIERSLAYVIHTTGIAVGLILGYLLVAEFHRILGASPIREEKRERLLGYLIGILALSLVLYRLCTLLIVPSIIPGAPSEFYLLAAALGLWLGLPNSLTEGWMWIFAVPVAAGMFLGYSAIPLPSVPVMVSGTLFLSGIAILTERFKGFGFSVAVLGMALLYHGWNSAAFIEENLSMPIAVIVGSAVIGILIFLLVRNAVMMQHWERGAPVFRIAGGAIIILAVALRIGDYAEWYEKVVSGEMILGYVRIPLLGLLLLTASLFAWPRRRRIREILKIQTQKPILHWVLLILCFFLFPYGTVQVRNFLHEPSAPTGDTARRILTRILSNTYQAFNFKDEEQLYNRLLETVSGDLVESVYLDSRRKLTSGVRKGAEVTVQEVRVISVGGKVRGSNAVEGYTYECKWSVTARVRHLQHVHHRQNIYTGLLRVQAVGDSWKIGDIALISEDRVIIPWSSG